MPSLGMQGPYKLESGTIDMIVPRTHPGNYAIGYRRDSGAGAFVVRYIGRADSDLNRELKSQASDGLSWFKWCYAPSEKIAFDKECKNYHDFGESRKLENEGHPVAPNGTNWKCPVCNR